MMRETSCCKLFWNGQQWWNTSMLYSLLRILKSKTRSIFSSIEFVREENQRQKLFELFQGRTIGRRENVANFGQLFESVVQEESERLSQHIVFVSRQRHRLPSLFQLFSYRQQQTMRQRSFEMFLWVTDPSTHLTLNIGDVALNGVLMENRFGLSSQVSRPFGRRSLERRYPMGMIDSREFRSATSSFFRSRKTNQSSRCVTNKDKREKTQRSAITEHEEKRTTETSRTFSRCRWLKIVSIIIFFEDCRTRFPSAWKWV